MQVCNDRPTRRVTVLTYEVIILSVIFLITMLYFFRHCQTDNYNHQPKMAAAQETKQEDG